MMLTPVTQESVFARNLDAAWRPIQGEENRTGPGLLTMPGQAGSGAAANRVEIGTVLRDLFEPERTLPTYGPGGVIENLAAYRENPQGRRALLDAAGFYEDAGPTVVSEGQLFSGNDTVTPAFGALAGTLAASIRDNAVSANDADSTEAIRQAASLYILTSPASTGEAGLLPSPSLFAAEPASAYDVFALPPAAETAAAFINILAGGTGGPLADAANLYLSTGYRQFQTPRLLIDIFA